MPATVAVQKEDTRGRLRECQQAGWFHREGGREGGHRQQNEQIKNGCSKAYRWEIINFQPQASSVVVSTKTTWQAQIQRFFLWPFYLVAEALNWHLKLKKYKLDLAHLARQPGLVGIWPSFDDFYSAHQKTAPESCYRWAKEKWPAAPFWVALWNWRLTWLVDLQSNLDWQLTFCHPCRWGLCLSYTSACSATACAFCKSPSKKFILLKENNP